MSEPEPPAEIPGRFMNTLQAAKDMLPGEWVPYIEQAEHWAQAHPFLGGMVVGAVLAAVLLQSTTIIRTIIVGLVILAGGTVLLGNIGP